MSQYSQEYAMKELQAAVQSLEGEGDPRKKLLSASVYHLIHVNPENLPERSRELMSTIRQVLFYGPAEGYDGIAEASIAAMTDLQVSGMIESIVWIGSRKINSRISILDEAASLVELASARVRLVRTIESTAQGPVKIADAVNETYRKALREYRAVLEAQRGRGSA